LGHCGRERVDAIREPTRWRLFALPEPREVGSDDAEAIAKRAPDPVPNPVVDEEAVQEHDTRAVALFDDAQPHASRSDVALHCPGHASERVLIEGAVGSPKHRPRGSYHG